MLHLTAKNFDTEVKHESLPVVVMFYAVWCGKCAMMKPIAEDAEKKPAAKKPAAKKAEGEKKPAAKKTTAKKPAAKKTVKKTEDAE